MTLTDPLPTAAAEAVVPLAGEIDVSSAPRLRAELHGRIDVGTQNLVLDVSELAFIDSAGLGVIVGAARRLRDERSGSVVLRGVQPQLLRVLRLTRLDHVFEIES